MGHGPRDTFVRHEALMGLSVAESQMNGVRLVSARSSGGLVVAQHVGAHAISSSLGEAITTTTHFTDGSNIVLTTLNDGKELL